MIKLEQKGFTLVEMLISIGILGIVAPLLGLALFQILTFTERGRAGFEAQADTRTASGWVSQDIVMAQGTVPVLNVGDFVTDPACLTPVGFTWTDKYQDRDDVYTVSYCVRTDPPPLPGDPVPECPAVSPCLVRNLSVVDSDGNPVSDGSKVIARNIAFVKFEATAIREISVTIRSAPENRFGVDDEKIFRVLMRPTIDPQ